MCRRLSFVGTVSGAPSASAVRRVNKIVFLGLAILVAIMCPVARASFTTNLMADVRTILLDVKIFADAPLKDQITHEDLTERIRLLIASELAKRNQQIDVLDFTTPKWTMLSRPGAVFLRVLVSITPDGLPDHLDQADLLAIAVEFRRYDKPPERLYNVALPPTAAASPGAGDAIVGRITDMLVKQLSPFFDSVNARLPDPPDTVIIVPPKK
jgi:hypothetical protein